MLQIHIDLLMKVITDWEQTLPKGCKQFKEQVLDKLLTHDDMSIEKEGWQSG